MGNLFIKIIALFAKWRYIAYKVTNYIISLKGVSYQLILHPLDVVIE